MNGLKIKNIRSMNIKLLYNLIQQNVKCEMHIEAAGDRHVNGPQSSQILAMRHSVCRV